mmetsp:Transcript_31415/g.59754  ORF Transcript_31415/g.59754 Transcript_31415/m.59754 type:complete len:103 (-) Transcript_31415:80-388(-)
MTAARGCRRRTKWSTKSPVEGEVAVADADIDEVEATAPQFPSLCLRTGATRGVIINLPLSTDSSAAHGRPGPGLYEYLEVLVAFREERAWLEMELAWHDVVQ